MKNNVNSKVAVNNANRDCSKFNFDHDNNTTASLGQVQPLVYQEMYPHDKVNLSVNSLVRTTPLVVPSWAKFKMKTWTDFVPITSVFPNYDYFVTHTAKRSAVGKFNVNTLPWITTAQLTMLATIGAKVKIWFDNRTLFPEAEEGAFVRVTKDTKQSIIDAIKTVADEFSAIDDYSRIEQFDCDAVGFNINYLWGSSNGWGRIEGTRTHMVPIGNSSKYDVFIGETEISPSSCDLMFITVPSEARPYKMAVCFEFSDWGKNFAKLCRTFGYNLDFRADTIDDRVDFLPFLAWYLSYFRKFGIERKRNWESTWCHQIIHYIETYGDAACDFGVTSDFWRNENDGTIFWNFIIDELSESFYPTEDYNFISAHRAEVTETAWDNPVNVFDSNALHNLVDIANRSINSRFIQTRDYDTTVGSDDNGVEATHTYDLNTQIFDIAAMRKGLGTEANAPFSAMEIECLKRLQRATSKHDVLGQNVRALLKAFGLDAYNDEEDVDFVGYREFDLNISEVTALADTFNVDAGDNGRRLAEQGGKSISSSLEDNKTDYARSLDYSTDVRGYFICMGGVMPESGFVNMADERHYMITRAQQYDKEFEGMGYDASRIERLFGDSKVAWQTSTLKKHFFGVVPRWSALKVKSNINNGDFNRPNKSAAMLPYTADKIVRLNAVNGSVRSVDWPIMGTVQMSSFVKERYSYDKIPLAGKDWAYVYRFGFMGLLNRMFVNPDREKVKTLTNPLGEIDVRSSNIWVYTIEDNFIIHSRMNMSYWSEMLPIEDTYMTQDDEAKANQAVKLA